MSQVTRSSLLKIFITLLIPTSNMASAPPVYHQQPIGMGAPTVEVIRLPNNFSSKPMDMQCNVCRAHVRTATNESCNPICCILFGCWALCCCQDVEHKCPNCNAVLGVHKAV